MRYQKVFCLLRLELFGTGLFPRGFAFPLPALIAPGFPRLRYQKVFCLLRLELFGTGLFPRGFAFPLPPLIAPGSPRIRYQKVFCLLRFFLVSLSRIGNYQWWKHQAWVRTNCYIFVYLFLIFFNQLSCVPSVLYFYF